MCVCGFWVLLQQLVSKEVEITFASSVADSMEFMAKITDMFVERKPTVKAGFFFRGSNWQLVASYYFPGHSVIWNICCCFLQPVGIWVVHFNFTETLKSSIFVPWSIRPLICAKNCGAFDISLPFSFYWITNKVKLTFFFRLLNKVAKIIFTNKCNIWNCDSLLRVKIQIYRKKKNNEKLHKIACY